ncbi:MAG: TatD family hydrolase [Bacteroidales bacterium]|nr:TatD family hydrolase [Bacteroidales bacterium]
MLIDTHSHIYLEEFDNDIDDVIKNAVDAGIEKIILPNIDFYTINKMKNVKLAYPLITELAIGLHPTSVDANYKKSLDLIFNDFNVSEYVAIGEVGIDLYWDKTFIEHQKTAFDYQIELAKKYNLPIIIHSRNSYDEIIDVLKPHIKSGIRGVFHCFPGNSNQAKMVIDMGFYIGIGGILTYKNSNMPEVVEKIPIEYILLETDAPYLSPVPKRGKRNEPAYVKYVAEEISHITGTPFEEVCKITSDNAKQVFYL